MNRWGIPELLERFVSARDTSCIYCGSCFVAEGAKRGQKASWEHIINDARIITPGNIALCCISCNASKGNRTLSEWLKSRYCQRRAITRESIAEVAKAALDAQLTQARSQSSGQ
jgi:hypothetical protein